MRRHLLFAAILLAPSASIARIGAVPNAAVNEGVFSAAMRHSYNLDDESASLDRRLRSRIITDYGVNDWYAIGIILQGEKLDDRDADFTSTILEQRFELTDMQSHGFYSGFRLRYSYQDGDDKPDNTHIRLIIGKQFGAWDARLNQIIGTEIGQDRQNGVLWDTRTQITYEYKPGQRIGFETFSNLGNLSQQNGYQGQNHTAGPVFIGAIDAQTGYEFGYMAGVSDAAPDHSFYFGINRTF